MKEVKDTKRATVYVGFDGKVHKRFLGPHADLRFQNEVRVLQYLEKQACSFVPRLIHTEPDELYMVTTNCGAIVDKISDERLKTIFAELEQYGVEHGDPFARNITYSPHLGRFCVIDFEFARIIATGEGLSIKDLEEMDANE